MRLLSFQKDRSKRGYWSKYEGRREWLSKGAGRSVGRTSPLQAKSAPPGIEEPLCCEHRAADRHRRGSWMERAFDLLEQFGNGVERDARPESPHVLGADHKLP